MRGFIERHGLELRLGYDPMSGAFLETCPDEGTEIAAGQLLGGIAERFNDFREPRSRIRYAAGKLAMTRLILWPVKPRA